MNITHPEMVRTLRKDGAQILSTLTGEDADLIHMAMGIAGEAGELLDAVKKATMYHQAIDMDNVIEELGDMEFFMEGLRQVLRISRESTLRANMTKLATRYEGHQYSDAQAKLRRDKLPLNGDHQNAP